MQHMQHTWGIGCKAYTEINMISYFDIRIHDISPKNELFSQNLMMILADKSYS